VLCPVCNLPAAPDHSWAFRFRELDSHKLAAQRCRYSVSSQRQFDSDNSMETSEKSAEPGSTRTATDVRQGVSPARLIWREISDR
jgi:hypothetical protein